MVYCIVLLTAGQIKSARRIKNLVMFGSFLRRFDPFILFLVFIGKARNIVKKGTDYILFMYIYAAKMTKYEKKTLFLFYNRYKFIYNIIVLLFI